MQTRPEVSTPPEEQVVINTYRLLLSLYPKAFKKRWTGEMVRAFTTDYTRAVAAKDRFGFFRRSFKDAGMSILGEWTATLRKTLRSTNRRWRPRMDFSATQDLALATRTLRRSPTFALTAISVLGLGIGANATIYSLVDALLLTDPPRVQEPDRLVRLTRARGTSQSLTFSYPDYAFYRDNNASMSGVAAYTSAATTTNVTVGTAAFDMRVGAVSTNYFDVLGVPLPLGRSFDDIPIDHLGASPTAILTAQAAQLMSRGDESLIGSTVALNGRPFTIVGITPQDFVGISPVETQPDIYIPLEDLSVLSPGSASLFRRVLGERDNWLNVFGRLQTTVTFAAAQENLAVVNQRLQTEYSAWSEGDGLVVSDHVAYTPARRASVASLMVTLFGASAAVLIIACSNVAVLLLVRVANRRHEISLRAALGASRWRLVQLTMIETGVITFAGLVAGLVIAFTATGIVGDLLPFTIMSVRPSIGVLAYSAILGCLTCLAIGAAPAWHLGRSSLSGENRRGTLSNRATFVRNLMVVSQIAISIPVTAGAMLFIRSFHLAQAVELQYDTNSRHFVSLNLSNHDYSDDRRVAFLTALMSNLAEQPRFQGVTAAFQMPFRSGWGGGFTAEGITPPGGADQFDGNFNSVGPGFFTTLGIEMVEGRDFGIEDDADAAGVVIVNEAMAKTLWPETPALGKRIARSPLGPWFTVVGVTRDAVFHSLDEPPAPQIFFPLLQYMHGSFSVIVHADGTSSSVMDGTIEQIRRLDPVLAIRRDGAVQGLVDTVVAPYRTLASLIGTFGSLAVFLASVGLYGVLTYVVTERYREIGIRAALGASRFQVADTVIKRSWVLSGLGIVIGLAVAFGGSRLVEGSLFGITPLDPTSYLVVPFILLIVATLATAAPAIKASRIDPMISLSRE